MIDWDPVDILACLETEPSIDEEERSYRYVLRRDGILLALEIWSYDSDVWLAIRLADHPNSVLDLRMQGCRAIRYVHEGHTEELHFISYDERERIANLTGGWCLRVRPNIEVKIGGAPGT